MPDTTEANLFADYIYGTYLHQDCSYPPIMWADILCRNVKTTNACEAFHRHFQSSLQTYHPNIFKIEQVSNNELKGHYQRGKRYASKEEQRASVAEKYKHGEIDIVGYLFKMSKVMQPARECRIFKALLTIFTDLYRWSTNIIMRSFILSTVSILLDLVLRTNVSPKPVTQTVIFVVQYGNRTITHLSISILHGAQLGLDSPHCNPHLWSSRTIEFSNGAQLGCSR